MRVCECYRHCDKRPEVSVDAKPLVAEIRRLGRIVLYELRDAELQVPWREAVECGPPIPIQIRPQRQRLQAVVDFRQAPFEDPVQVRHLVPCTHLSELGIAELAGARVLPESAVPVNLMELDAGLLSLLQSSLLELHHLKRLVRRERRGPRGPQRPRRGCACAREAAQEGPKQVGLLLVLLVVAVGAPAHLPSEAACAIVVVAAGLELLPAVLDQAGIGFGEPPPRVQELRLHEDAVPVVPAAWLAPAQAGRNRLKLVRHELSAVVPLQGLLALVLPVAPVGEAVAGELLVGRPSVGVFGLHRECCTAEGQDGEKCHATLRGKLGRHGRLRPEFVGA
mmetsp:Transcript_57753/g.115732  ORF Transcript_57753/g.115732 Transcript_57753/m.115732 type:complete len:337 (+) Transcript_57753:352-1362(+)